MADATILDLPVDTSPSGTDVIETVKDPAGTPSSQQVSFANVTKAISVMVGDSGSGGTKGLVPAPGAGDAAAGKFLKADGTFAVPSGTGAETGANSDITSMDGLTGALETVTRIDFAEGAAPSTPAAGEVSLYAKADGKLYIKDDAGTETDLTDGAGAGYAGVTTGGTGSLDFAQGTKTADEPFIDASVTWNNGGVTFNGIKLSVTNTASATASRLIDLLVGGASVFAVVGPGTSNCPQAPPQHCPLVISQTRTPVCSLEAVIRSTSRLMDRYE